MPVEINELLVTTHIESPHDPLTPPPSNSDQRKWEEIKNEILEECSRMIRDSIESLHER